MKITELQNIKVFRIRNDNVDDEMIMILEEGEPQFYSEIEMKYSDFEKAKLKEKMK